MASIYVVMAIMLGISLVTFLLSLAVFVIWENYYRRPNFFRAIMLMKDGRYRLLWLRRTGKMEGKYHVATKGKDSYLYEDNDVIGVGKFQGLFVKDDSTHALRMDTSKTKFLDKTSINAQSMKEVLETKLISELVQPRVDVMALLTLVGIGLVVLAVIVIYYKTNQMTSTLNTINENMELIKAMLVDQSGQVIRPIR